MKIRIFISIFQEAQQGAVSHSVYLYWLEIITEESILSKLPPPFFCAAWEDNVFYFTEEKTHVYIIL